MTSPQLQNEYELVTIVVPTAGEDDVTKARSRIEGIIENEGGHLLRFDEWGQRKLAYPIRVRAENTSYTTGNYSYCRFLAPSSTVAELERNLRILPQIMKYLTVKLDENLIPEERLKIPTVAEDIDVTCIEEEE